MNTTKTATKNVGISEKDTDGANLKDKKIQGNKLGHLCLYIQDLRWWGKTLYDKQNFVAFSRVQGLLLPMQFSSRDKGETCYRETCYICRFKKHQSNAPKCANSTI